MTLRCNSIFGGIVMITSNDLRNGTVIKVDGDLYSVVDYQHVKLGRGGAFVQTKLKSITKGTIVDKKFKGGEKVEDVRIEKKILQFLYDEGDALVFMDTETYDQLSVDKKKAGNLLNYIKEGDNVEATMYNDDILSIEPPIFVVLKVTYAEPGVKGDTATNVLKPVTVETGATIQVPIFVNEGDTIKVDTRKGEYVERVKR